MSPSPLLLAVAVALVAGALGCAFIEEDEVGQGGTYDPGASVSCTGDDGSGYSAQYQSLECGVLDLVNDARSKGATCGGVAQPAVPPLRMHRTLRASARAHAVDMSQKDYFSHDNLSGLSPFDRIEAAGYDFATAGENIAGGSATAAATMAQWMSSPGHCRNIMSSDFEDIGVGYARNPNSELTHYWVQNFATPR